MSSLRATSLTSPTSTILVREPHLVRSIATNATAILAFVNLRKARATPTTTMKAAKIPTNKSFLKNHFAFTCFLPLPIGLPKNLSVPVGSRFGTLHLLLEASRLQQRVLSCPLENVERQLLSSLAALLFVVLLRPPGSMEGFNLQELNRSSSISISPTTTSTQEQRALAGSLSIKSLKAMALALASVGP